MVSLLDPLRRDSFGCCCKLLCSFYYWGLRLGLLCCLLDSNKGLFCLSDFIENLFLNIV